MTTLPSGWIKNSSRSPGLTPDGAGSFTGSATLSCKSSELRALPHFLRLLQRQRLDRRDRGRLSRPDRRVVVHVQFDFIAVGVGKIDRLGYAVIFHPFDGYPAPLKFL